MSTPTISAPRAVCYVDGFNLYHGIREHSKCRYYRWLDLRSLVSGLLLPGHALERVIFFTSTPRWNAAKARRHQTYASALASTGVEIVPGRFQTDETVCGASCKELYFRDVEKLTDVNIATRILTDSVTDRVDWVYLLSGDADQVPTVHALRALAPKVKVHVIFPPRRSSTELQQIADRAFGEIGFRKLKAAQFSDVIVTPGYTIRKPAKWIEQEEAHFLEPATGFASPSGPARPSSQSPDAF